jgi:beta-galactosidase/beta-glucuronidase
MQNTRTLLNKNWQWRLVSTTPENTKLLPNSVDLTQWQEAQHSPSEIHLELLSRKLLLDYNVGQNERKIQWVGRSDWEYRCTFTTPQETFNSRYKHVDLFFEGLDTFATVTLNGEEIAKSDNQFIPFRVDVAEILAEPSKKVNELVILFESAERMGTELEKKWGARTSLMRDKKRMNMRKAQVCTPY